MSQYLELDKLTPERQQEVYAEYLEQIGESCETYSFLEFQTEAMQNWWEFKI